MARKILPIFAIQEPEPGVLHSYVQRHGARSNRILEVLKTNSDLMQRFNDTKDSIILQYMLEIHEAQFTKIASLNATDEDKLKYQVIQELIEKILMLENIHTKARKEVEKNK
jgi:hypothetical protein